MKANRTIFTAALSAWLCTFLLFGCKSKEAVTQAPVLLPSTPIQVSGTELDPYAMHKVRTPEAIHGYYLGPYTDPQDSGIRHDGHRITRVERPANWNLSPGAPTAVPLGPVIAVADPAQQTAPLSAELEIKIAQANTLIAALIEQNDELQAELKQKDSEIEALAERISQIEQSN